MTDDLTPRQLALLAFDCTRNADCWCREAERCYRGRLPEERGRALASAMRWRGQAERYARAAREQRAREARA